MSQEQLHRLVKGFSWYGVWTEHSIGVCNEKHISRAWPHGWPDPIPGHGGTHMLLSQMPVHMMTQADMQPVLEGMDVLPWSFAVWQ